MDKASSYAFDELSNPAEMLDYNEVIDLSPVSNAGLSSLTPISNSLICSDSRCNCGKSFHRRHQLTKHLNRVIRPYFCSYEECTSSVRAFATRSDRNRHESERHGKWEIGTAGIYCPERSCKRHTTAFTRKSNLKSHMARTHLQTPSVTSYNAKKLRASAPTLTPLLPASLLVGRAASGSVASDSVSSAAFRSESPSLSTAMITSSRASVGLPEVPIVDQLRTEQRMHIRCAEELENAIQAYNRSQQSKLWQEQEQQQQQQQGDMNPAMMLNWNLNGIDGWDCGLDTMNTLSPWIFEDGGAQGAMGEWN